VNISIVYPNNNFSYNNSNPTTVPIDKVTGKRRKTTAEERISVIEKKARAKAAEKLQKSPGYRSHRLPKL
jgi:hypothetical protein